MGRRRTGIAPRVAALYRGRTRPADVARKLGISRQAVSRHLKLANIHPRASEFR